MNEQQRYQVVVGTRGELGALSDRISDWRTERYIEAGFYSPGVVATMRRLGLPLEDARPDDYEVAAIGSDGSILATLSLRRPMASEGWSTTDSHRPSYGLESVHGTDFVGSLDPIGMDRCWEAGRFLRDRNVDCSAAVVAVTTTAAELLARLAASGEAKVVIGEVEPTVALRHLDAFGLPVTTGDELAAPEVRGLLENRYAGRTVVPFAIDLATITEAHRRTWRAMANRSHLLEEATNVV